MTNQVSIAGGGAVAMLPDTATFALGIFPDATPLVVGVSDGSSLLVAAQGGSVLSVRFLGWDGAVVEPPVGPKFTLTDGQIVMTRSDFVPTHDFALVNGQIVMEPA